MFKFVRYMGTAQKRVINERLRIIWIGWLLTPGRVDHLHVGLRRMALGVVSEESMVTIPFERVIVRHFVPSSRIGEFFR